MRVFLKWSVIPTLCDYWHVPRVQELGRGLGYKSGLRVLRLLSVLPSVSLADGIRVIMAHDSDRIKGWRESLEAARDEWLVAMKTNAIDADVVLGIAHPEHEAWVLAAFTPCDERERRQLATLRQSLGFDPTANGHRLTSGDEARDPRDAKRTLAALGLDVERRRELMRTVPLDLLRQRGEAIGLTAFLEELRVRATSAFGP